ncbi:MAG: alpha/beta hydrolase [Planctomycetia bacterium]|nr:alpha/beta hydrolase [Planctomycetia bacterium]
MAKMIHWKTRKGMLLGISLILGGVLALLLGLPSLERQMVFPGHQTQGMKDVQINSEDSSDNLIELTTKSGHQTFFRSVGALTSSGKLLPNFNDSPTLIFFYGNGGCLGYMNSIFQNFRKIGVNVVIPEYVGYGISPGRPTENDCYETALAVYDYLIDQKKCSPEKIIVSGHSLGTAVACGLASQKKVGGLIFFSGFTSLPETGQILYPFLPVHWLLHSEFASIEKIPSLYCPFLLIHGDQDSIVPLEMMQTNAEIARQNGLFVETLILKNAGHDIFGEKDHFETILQTVQDFLLKTHCFDAEPRKSQSFEQPF